MKTNRRQAMWVAIAAMVLVCATLLSVKSSGQDDRPGGWQVTRAEYGWHERQNDVTDLLRDLISRGGVEGRIAVNNQTMGGDPAVAQDKVLKIVARNREGQEREFLYKEGSFVDVAMFVVRRDDWDDRPRQNGDRGGDERAGVWIIRGYWGVQGRTVNVTDALRGMQHDGRLVVRANNQAFGADPAPGADKVLIVVYRVQGQETATAVREGNTLAIP